MPWGEAIRLTRVITLDPSSALSMSLNEWDRPTSREALVLMDVYDVLDATRAGRKAKRYPRPWGDKARKNIGRGARLTVDQLRRVLDAHRTDEGGEHG